MRAFLLAAGRGTRLEPLTFHTPKCLIPINDRPLIEYWFDLFEFYEIHEILINTSHLAGKVRDYIENHSRSLKIKLTYEEKLLGSGGTIKSNWDFVKAEDSFLIFYADNLTNVHLEEMIRLHNEHDKDFTLGLFKVTNPTECGVVEIDENLTVVSFIEKPKNPPSNLAFAGIMVSSQKLQEYFPDKDVFDLGYDILPQIVKKTSGYIIKDYLLDIGSPEKLKQANEDVRNNVFKNIKISSIKRL